MDALARVLCGSVAVSVGACSNARCLADAFVCIRWFIRMGAVTRSSPPPPPPKSSPHSCELGERCPYGDTTRSGPTAARNGKAAPGCRVAGAGGDEPLEDDHARCPARACALPKRPLAAIGVAHVAVPWPGFACGLAPALRADVHPRRSASANGGLRGRRHVSREAR